MVIGGEELRQLALGWGVPEDQIGGASIDIRLDTHIKYMPPFGEPSDFFLEKGERFIFVPSGFYLGSSVEKIELPVDVVGDIRVRSSPGRMGLTHLKSDFIEPGFRGHVTIEFFVRRGLSFAVGTVPVFQIVLFRATSSEIYSGRYQDQPGKPVQSRDDRFEYWEGK